MVCSKMNRPLYFITAVIITIQPNNACATYPEGTYPYALHMLIKEEEAPVYIHQIGQLNELCFTRVPIANLSEFVAINFP